MKKLMVCVAMVLTAALLTTTTGCELLNPPKKNDGGGDSSANNSGGGGGGDVDMAKTMAASAQAPWLISLHSGAKEGQWAEWDMSGSKQWWGVTGKKDGLWVVEMRMKIGASWITYAYLSDKDGNVKKAYIANWKPDAKEPQEGKEIKIAKKTEAKPTDAPKPETGEETVKAAGKDWKCTWTKVDAGGKPATSWLSEDMWFTKIVKSSYDGKETMKLAKLGDDAKLGLKFPK